MINTGIEIKLYTLNELNEKAQHKAIEAHREFMLSIMQPSDFICGEAEYDTPEALQEAYNAEYDHYAMIDEPIIENIESNDYLFFEDGELAHTVRYYGSHPLSGGTHLLLNGTDYRID